MKARLYTIAIALILSPTITLGAADGAALYASHCSACHQRNSGGIGLPLSPSKMATVPDGYIKATIRNGRIGRIMPAFTKLSDAEIDAITQYIRSWSGIQAPQYDKKPVPGDAARGQELYKNHCSQCHATDGSGGGLGTGVTFSRERSFAVMPPAITNPGFLASASDQMIKQVIIMGRPGTAMRSFLDEGLKEKDINDLVSYIRSFEKNQPIHSVDSGAEPVDSPALIFESPYDFDTTVQNLKNAIKGRNFRYFPDRYLETGFADNASIQNRQMTIRFCNFNQLYRLIRIEPRFGVSLPCRITVTESPSGEVKIVAMNMQIIADLFNNDQLIEAGKQLNEIQIDIIEEATL